MLLVYAFELVVLAVVVLEMVPAAEDEKMVADEELTSVVEAYNLDSTVLHMGLVENEAVVVVEELIHDLKEFQQYSKKK